MGAALSRDDDDARRQLLARVVGDAAAVRLDSRLAAALSPNRIAEAARPPSPLDSSLAAALSPVGIAEAARPAAPLAGAPRYVECSLAVKERAARELITAVHGEGYVPGRLHQRERKARQLGHASWTRVLDRCIGNAFLTPALNADIDWLIDPVHRLAQLLSLMPQQMLETPFFGGIIPRPVAVPISITLRTVLGTSSTLDCTLDWTVLDVKDHVYEQDLGPPPEQARLICEGAQLREELTLSESNVQSGSTVHVLLRLRGGTTVDGMFAVLPGPNTCLRPDEWISMAVGLRGNHRALQEDHWGMQDLSDLRSMQVEIGRMRPTISLRSMDATGPSVARWDRNELMGLLYMWRHSPLAQNLDVRAIVLRHLQLPLDQWERSDPVACAVERNGVASVDCGREGSFFGLRVAPPDGGWQPGAQYLIRVQPLDGFDGFANRWTFFVEAGEALRDAPPSLDPNAILSATDPRLKRMGFTRVH